ncbi:hypothetical protein BABINDRAFT_166716 [Babjeviella inositovora NRRL Y-12698]|uniref:Mitochondrial 15S rRNA processing factor CCM1 n=1 Tax=Babjeviella inositovora NRRL Y-12698 TaxID=984486 RepID=A0A1E3QRW2_9ASCO|nr:uncharacterized protein BABINDRAFT_166716 [Babjeviella inositovora NRRL Y-12698]ODQ80378.1 hypothetical protein BABINDRAFT_166716 [Babjeviella inositovora NRRL Y-12698]
MLFRGTTRGAAAVRRAFTAKTFSTTVASLQEASPPLKANGRPKTRGGQNRNKHNPDRKFQPPHPQLVQISSQLSLIVEQGETAEALELLGKSVEFLRQIPEVSARALVKQFAEIGNTLLVKASSANSTTSPFEVLNALTQHGVSHISHYLAVMQYAVAKGQFDEAFAVWVQYKEAVQANADVNVFLKTHPYSNNDIVRTTYLTYVMSCISKAIVPEYKTALSVLQVDALPEANHMRNFMKTHSALVPKGGAISMDAVSSVIRKLNVSALDPNDGKLYLEAERAATDGKFAAVDRILDSILASDKPVAETTMVRFMNLYAVRGQRYVKALEIFNTLLQSGIKPTAPTFNAAIMTLAKFAKQPVEARVAKVQEILKTMESLEVAPNKDTYASLIELYAVARKFDEVDKLYASVNKTQVVRDAYVASMVARGDLPKAARVLQTMIAEDDYVPNARVFNKFIQHHIANREYDQAAKSLNALYECGGSPDVATYTMTIDLLFKSSRRNGATPDFGLIVKTLEEMSQHGLPNNIYTLTAILDGLLKNGTDLEAARAIWKYMQLTLKYTPTKTTYTTMISGELDFGDTARAEALFAEMLARAEFHKQASDWNLMIVGFVKKGDAARAQEYFTRMQQAGEKDVKQRPNHYTFGFMMRDAIRREDWAAVSDMLAVYVAYRLPLAVPQILTILGNLDATKVAFPQEVKDILAQESSARYANRKLAL